MSASSVVPVAAWALPRTQGTRTVLSAKIALVAEAWIATENREAWVSVAVAAF